MKFLQQWLGSYGLTETSRGCKKNRLHLAASERRSAISCNFLQLFSSCREHSGSTKVVRRRTWQPLNPGEYKTNFDGAMFNECNEVGVGIVVVAMAKNKK